MPPPWNPAVLPEMVQSVRVAVSPVKLARPPPLLLVELPLMVQSLMVSVPLLLTAPPKPAVPLAFTKPWVIVSPDSDAESPELMTNTWLALLPLMDRELAPGPLMVTPWLIVSAPLLRVMTLPEERLK